MADIGILRAAIAPMTRFWRRSGALDVTDQPMGDVEQQARGQFRSGLLKMRGGDTRGALEAFDKAIALLPDLADAVMARAELLDRVGRCEEARGEYERARRLWAEAPAGAADRRYVFRRHGYYAFETVAYELVRSNVRSKVLPQIAHGNARLARGKPAEALESYEQALKVKPGLPEAMAMKGEALLGLGRYQEAAQLFDGVLAASPSDTETLNSRGIARAAMGRLAEANDDWRRQLELMPPTKAAARGCVAMRQGNHAAAFHEFELARAKDPANLYWQLYRLTAARLAGVQAAPLTVADVGEHWPSVLIALHAGAADEEAVLKKADSRCRNVEARFQLGVVALGANPAAARRHWQAVVEAGAVTLIEHAAASNELARLGS